MAYTKVHAFVDKHVAIALDQQPTSAGKTVQKGKYILLHQMAIETKNPYELRHQILNVFFPNRDTTAIERLSRDLGRRRREVRSRTLW